MITSTFPVAKFRLSRENTFLSKTCPKILQKQQLANEIKICSLYIYCALSATLKFNFKPLFDFIKAFKKYLKQSIQNSLNKYEFSFFRFHSNSGRLNILQFCRSILEIPVITTGGHLGSYSLRTGELTDLSRRKKNSK